MKVTDADVLCAAWVLRCVKRRVKRYNVTGTITDYTLNGLVNCFIFLEIIYVREEKDRKKGRRRKAK